MIASSPEKSYQALRAEHGLTSWAIKRAARLHGIRRSCGRAQTYAVLAFVCGSSSVPGISRLDVSIVVDVPMLRTEEEAKCGYL